MIIKIIQIIPAQDGIVLCRNERNERTVIAWALVETRDPTRALQHRIVPCIFGQEGGLFPVSEDPGHELKWEC